jgi:hypothetical protein
MRPATWGWTTAGVADEDLSRALGVAAGPVEFLSWDLDPVSLAGRANGFTVPLTPFLGVIGMPPAEPGEHSTTPPRTLGGGNLDCRELVAGSTLYLPVTVPGAALCLGDGHAAQGDGEVSGTAIEWWPTRPGACTRSCPARLSAGPRPPRFLVDSVRADRLVDACTQAARSTCMFAVAPLPVAGGTGSPVNPICIL